MKYCTDWEKTKQRLASFWKRELTDRCCVCITAPRAGTAYTPEKLPESPAEKERYWTDAEWVLRRARALFESTYYAGDAFPCLSATLGPSGHAGFFKNCRYQFESTVWFFPFLETADAGALEFDPESLLYRKTLELARYYAAEGRGEFVISMPDNSGNLDALAHIRGSENILMDMVEDEVALEAALHKVQAVWRRTNEEVYQIVKDNNDGGSAIGWLNTWAPGRHAQIHCDLSVMIAPPLYTRFFAPELQAQTEWMNHSLYHLDGMEQVRHLDTLLSAPRLDAIQWTNVVGQPPVLEAIPVLQRIQAAGKGVYVILTPAEIEPVMMQLSSRGLFIRVRANSEDEARAALAQVEKLTRD